MPNPTYPGPETIQHDTLTNGVLLLVYENFASDSIALNGLVRAGALLDPPDQEGLSLFCANLLLSGTQQRSFGEIYEALESAGASLEFNSGLHATEFSAQALAEDFPLIVELLAESLRVPTFPTQQVELVRGQMLTDLQIRANDTRHVASVAFRELLYPNHPYGRASEGRVSTISAITQADIQAYHAYAFGPQGMIIALAGAVRGAEVVARLQSALGDWQNPRQPPSPQVPDMARPETTYRAHIAIPDKSQTDLILGLPGPRRSAPDYLDAKLMNTILGVFGMMGRIGENLREKRGLAYYAYSHLQGGLGPSPWMASAGVAPEDVAEAIEAILQEIARIQEEPVPAEELADSQSYITGSMPVGLETNSGLASVLTDIALYDLGLDYLQRYPDMIWQITPQRVQAAAQKYLSTMQIAIASAGP